MAPTRYGITRPSLAIQRLVRICLTAPVADLVDTTAAGDSFNAGFLTGYANGSTIQDSVAFACKLARAVVQQRGALVPIELDGLALDEKT